MTTDQAMTDLSIQLGVKRRLGQVRQANALKLGIEALKVLERNRQNHPDVRFSLLPGETRE